MKSRIGLLIRNAKGNSLDVYFASFEANDSNDDDDDEDDDDGDVQSTLRQFKNVL